MNPYEHFRALGDHLLRQPVVHVMGKRARVGRTAQHFQVFRTEREFSSAELKEEYHGDEVTMLA
jgi:hypothetical protein